MPAETDMKLNYNEKTNTITCNDPKATDITKADVDALLNSDQGKIIKSKKEVGIDFSNCTKLQTVEFPENLAVKILRNCFKKSRKSLNKVVIPNCTEVREDAFWCCEELTTLDIKNCKEVGGETFSGCEKLQTVVLSNCKRVGEDAFYNCKSLQKVNLSKCTYVGMFAFSDCEKLEKVLLSNNATIEENAFSNCPNLKTPNLQSVQT